MQNELVNQGLTLMALGMGVVFIFLALLVIFTHLMSTIVERYFPEPIQMPQSTRDESSDLSRSGNLPDTRILTIIREAIRKHRES